MAYAGNPITALGQAFGILSPNASVYTPPTAAQGAPPVPGRLTKNPDGSSTDPATGVTYVTNPDGSMTAAHNPNTANQVAANANRAAGFFGQVPGFDQREAGAYQQQQDLAGALTQMVSGNGPTVAGNQLAIGQQQAAEQQLAQAAGASGNNAALARMAAMGNTEQLQSQTNQQAALQRAQEQTTAMNALGNVTGSLEQESAGMGAQKLAAGNAVNGLAATGENNDEALTEKGSNDNETVNASINQANAKATGGGLGALFSAL